MRVGRTGVLVIVLAATVPLPAAAQAGPAGPWRQYASAATAGFSAERLDAARRYADSVRSGAIMVILRGNVLAAWGDVSRPLELHSVRKSIVSALFGMAVADRRVDTSTTLGEIGIDDRQPLTSQEKSARIADLLAARSGIYLPAAYAAADQDSTRPPAAATRQGPTSSTTTGTSTSSA
jgi:CubicO group peptidase (beta-lactamase class C family)